MQVIEQPTATATPKDEQGARRLARHPARCWGCEPDHGVGRSGAGRRARRRDPPRPPHRPGPRGCLPTGGAASRLEDVEVVEVLRRHVVGACACSGVGRAAPLDRRRRPRHGPVRAVRLLASGGSWGWSVWGWAVEGCGVRSRAGGRSGRGSGCRWCAWCGRDVCGSRAAVARSIICAAALYFWSPPPPP